MRIAELVESIDLPQTQVAERAWDDGRRRVRRRRGATAGGAAALAVAWVVGIVAVTGRDHDTSPSPAPTATTSTAEPHTAPVVQRLLVRGHWRMELADLDYGRFSGNFDRAAGLSGDPVNRAVLAISDDRDQASALVLGEDGTWRRVDVPGLVPVSDQDGYTSPIVRPTSLSSDATRLALPQPDGLVVVDLTDGTSRRYDVPGPANAYAIWADGSHVLVAEESSKHGTLVDLKDGSLENSLNGPSTAILGETTLTWGSSALHSQLRWDDGRVVETEANNAGGFFPQPPLVRDDVVIGVEGVYSGSGALPFMTNGIVAVDGSTGKVLAYLPIDHEKATNALLLGWDGDRPVVGVPLHKEMGGLFVFAWDWHAGELAPIGHVGDWTSWGTGRLP